MQVETIPLAELSPHPDNPRNGDVEAIADSLRANGQYAPLIAAADGTVLVGNHRYAAMLELGWADAQVVRLPVDAFDEQAIRIMLADNRTSDRANYDNGVLLELLNRMDSATSLYGTGFDSGDLEKLNAKVMRELDTPLDLSSLIAPSVPPPRVRSDGSRLKLLDLFCGAGGASVGYARSGFEVWGVDIAHHPTYPYKQITADAMDILDEPDFVRLFDAVHASPPCQIHTAATRLRDGQGGTNDSPDLLAPTRERLKSIGVPYVIENVPGAPMENPLTLCGSMFDLAVRRHRLFESSADLGPTPECDHEGQGRPVGVYGTPGDVIPNGGRTARTVREAQAALGIDWMKWDDLVESIPPAYTEYLGDRMMAGVWS